MMKKNNMIIPLLAVLLILGVAIKPAMAYFTTFAQAEGGVKITLANQTEIQETVSDWTKHVVLTNKEDSSESAVRVKVYAGTQCPLTITGEGWSLGDDNYYYYQKALKPGESTTELLIKITNIPENPKEGDEFNVVVLQESVIATYDPEGNLTPDWTSPAINKDEYKPTK